jgi:cell division protein FtsZ
MDQEKRLTFSMPDDGGLRDTKKVSIKVVGVGGAGGNAVNRMIASGIDDVEFIAVNTDFQDLEKSLAPTKVTIGQKLTRGLGTGGNPDRGQQAAMEDMALITEHLQGADLVFVAAGMGGGTGTGAAPVVARLACEAGALTVAVVTRPFTWEGKRRAQNALIGLDQLMEAAATLIVVPNDKLLDNLPEDVGYEEAFGAADDVLRQGVQGIADLVTKPGMINLDFEDVRTVLSVGGRAVMGVGLSEGQDRAVEAVQKAANNPLLEDASIQGAQAILINISGGKSLKLREIDTACKFIQEKAHADANILFGTSVDESLGERVRITVVAASFETAEVRPMKRAAAQGAADTGPAPLNPLAVGGADDPTPTSISGGFMRKSEPLFTPPREETLQPSPSHARDFEKEQTPTFLRRSRD